MSWMNVVEGFLYGLGFVAAGGFIYLVKLIAAHKKARKRALILMIVPTLFGVGYGLDKLLDHRDKKAKEAEKRQEKAADDKLNRERTKNWLVVQYYNDGKAVRRCWMLKNRYLQSSINCWSERKSDLVKFRDKYHNWIPLRGFLFVIEVQGKSWAHLKRQYVGNKIKCME